MAVKQFIILAILPLFLSSYTLKGSKTFNATDRGNVGIPYVDEKHVYAYGVVNNSFFLLSFDRNSLELEKQHKVDRKTIENQYGKIIGIWLTHRENKVRVKFMVRKDVGADGYAAEFYIDQLLYGNERISYEKNPTENERKLAYKTPDINKSASWKHVKTENKESCFFGIYIGYDSKIYYAKAETSSGMTLKSFDFSFDKSFSSKYWKEQQENSTCIMKIYTVIKSNDNSTYVFANWQKEGSYTTISSSTYVPTETINYMIYQDLWVFKFDEQKGFMWGTVIPMSKSQENSSLAQKVSALNGTYIGYGIFETENEFHVLFNDNKKNEKKFDGYNASTRLYNLPTRNSDDGILVSISIDKSDGKTKREKLYNNHKTHSFIDCDGGYQYGNEFYMVDDIPKKNKARILKLTL